MSASTTVLRPSSARAFLRDVRSPRWGLAGQGFRYALVGLLAAGVYLSTTTLLHDVLAVRFQIALAIGFGASICVHFTLQRFFVWRHYEEFALAIPHQAVRYLSLCAVQYGLTAASTSQLPGLLGASVEIVYLVTVLTVSSLNFFLFRGRVFHVGEIGANGEAI